MAVTRFGALVGIAAIFLTLTACLTHAMDEPHPVSWTPGLASPGMPSMPSDVSKTAVNLLPLLSAPWGDSVELEDYRDGTHRVSVGNCSALFRALDANAYLQPRQAFETPAYLHRANQCLAIRALTQARDSNRSFVRSFRLDASAPDRLPAELAFVISREDEQRLAAYRGKVLSAVFANEEAFALKSVEVLNAYSARFSDQTDGRQEMTLLGYGDFDADGTEDLLLLVHNYIEDASYSAFSLYELTRHDNGPLSLLRIHEVLKAEED